MLSWFTCTCVLPRNLGKADYPTLLRFDHELSNLWLLLVPYSNQNEGIKEFLVWSSSHLIFTPQLLLRLPASVNQMLSESD